jgi:excinuclease UvrABC helicase subunit UvrB
MTAGPLRLSTTTARGASVCVDCASESCIFGLGSPEDYQASVIPLRVGDESSGTSFWAVFDLQ